MRATRRQVLWGLGAGTALWGCKDVAPDSAEPTPVRPPEPARWVPEESEDLALFPCGVQVCDVTDSSARVSVRTDAALASLRLMRAAGEGWEELLRQEPAAPAGGRLLADLSGLDADTAYCVAFFTEDGLRSAVTRFRTALAAGGYRVIRFGATSCLGNANPEWMNLGQAALEELDFFVLAGDTVYADGADTLEEYRLYWQSAMSKASFYALSSSTSFIATWDDHEVANEWVVGVNVTAERAEAGRQAMAEAVPNQPGGGAYGLWRALRWGELIEIFVLDARGERDAEGTRIISEEQLQWLVAGVAASTAQLKLVISSVHMADHTALYGSVYQEDRWQGYPAQRGPVVDALAAAPGVVVITGDMHFGALSYLDPAGAPGAGVPEVAAGPAGSTVNATVGFYEGDRAQYPILLPAWSYTLFEFDPGRSTLSLRFVDDAGAVLAEAELPIA